MLLLSADLFSADLDVRIKSVLSDNKTTLNRIITNTVTFLCRNIPDIQKIIIDYPKDPRIYGLDIVDIKYREKLSFNKKGTVNKIIKLEYHFKPKFIGVIAIEPIKINLVTLKDSKTNTYATKKIELTIYQEKNKYIWIYIIVLTILLIAGVMIILKYDKIRKSFNLKMKNK